MYEARKRNLSEYSGGMRQRFGIAQALLGNPKLIIVDEPTAGLDPAERNRFHNILSDLGENIIVILSTHIVEDIKNLCPRMVIMNRGQVLLDGKPSDTIAAMRNTICPTTRFLTNIARSFRVTNCSLCASGAAMWHW